VLAIPFACGLVEDEDLELGRARPGNLLEPALGSMRLLATSRVRWRGAMAQRQAPRGCSLFSRRRSAIVRLLSGPVIGREEYALRDAGGQRLARSTTASNGPTIRHCLVPIGTERPGKKLPLPSMHPVLLGHKLRRERPCFRWPARAT
jgi:hypothetical protein